MEDPRWLILWFLLNLSTPQVIIEIAADKKTFCDTEEYQPTCYILKQDWEFAHSLEVSVANTSFPDKPTMAVVFSECSFTWVSTIQKQVLLI